MKPYYAKYIREFTPIGVGDYIRSESISKRRVKVTEITSDGDYVTDEPEAFDPSCFYIVRRKNATKVSNKLYLCSKKIEVNDEICDDDDPTQFIRVTRIEGDKLYLDTTLFPHTPPEDVFVNISGVMKLIGEISSDAKWVREGDEFDEDDVRAFFNHPNWTMAQREFTLIGAKSIFGNKSRKASIVLKIMGPCGHYH